MGTPPVRILGGAGGPKCLTIHDVELSTVLTPGPPRGMSYRARYAGCAYTRAATQDAHLSAEPDMNIAAATASSPQSAVMADAMNAVAAVHVADIAVNPKTPIPIALLEQSPGYFKPTLDCHYCHLQASPEGETNINGDTLVKIRGNGGDSLNGLPVTLCQVVRGPASSLEITELCHHNIPVCLL